ncbi:MAG: diguanylate cyclase [Coriobacteriia bacterium]|nr:diguanylate cyclase [Coriobacteriia bacterium]
MPRRPIEQSEAPDPAALTERRIRLSLLLGAGAVALALTATFVLFQWRTEQLLRGAVPLSPLEVEQAVASGRRLTALALAGSLVTLLFVLYLIITRLLEAVLRAERRLVQLATHDALTGLVNRRVALQRLHEELLRSDRERRSLAVLMVDLDRFKDVNDSLGHAVGDATLVAAGYALSSEAREYDVVARLGGEEFLVLLPGTDSQVARGVAERMRRRVAEMTSAAVPELAEAVTASVGVAVHVPGDTEEADGVLARADRAMYAAKRRGRDCVMVA